MNDYDLALGRFLELQEQCGDQESFYREAQEQLGFSHEDVNRISAVIGSAQFRAAFGKLVASHSTNYEDDPWFLAAQRRFCQNSKA